MSKQDPLTIPLIRDFWREVFGIEYTISIHTAVSPISTRTSYGGWRRKPGIYVWRVLEISPSGSRIVAEGEIARKASAEAMATARLRDILDGI